MRQFNIPFPPIPPPTLPYMQSAFNYLYNRSDTKYQTDFMDTQQSIRTRQTSNSSSSSGLLNLPVFFLNHIVLLSRHKIFGKK